MSGANSLRADLHFLKVTGVDLCRPFIAHAESHRVGNETYLLTDMEDLDGVPDNEFDRAVSYISLVDVLDMHRAISAAFRVMSPGGRFVVCNVDSLVKSLCRSN